MTTDNTIKQCYVITNERGMYYPNVRKSIVFVSSISNAQHFWDKASAKLAMEHIHNPLNHVFDVVETRYNTFNCAVF